MMKVVGSTGLLSAFRIDWSDPLIIVGTILVIVRGRYAYVRRSGRKPPRVPIHETEYKGTNQSED